MTAIGIAPAAAPKAADGPVLYHFTFRHRGVPYEGVIAKGADGLAMRITGDAGPMPYSVESSSARYAIRAIVTEAALPDHATISVSPRQRVQVHAMLALGETPNPDRILATAITLLGTTDGIVRLVRHYLPRRLDRQARAA